MIDKLGEDAEFNIGVDIALGVGDQATITCGAFMIPVCILLAFIFPGNHFFPVAFFGFFSDLCNGNRMYGIQRKYVPFSVNWYRIYVLYTVCI